MATQSRKYDLVLLGANGYTGKYTAEHISTHLPTTLTWAVAGRSQSKLDSLADELKQQYPDRKQPEVRAVSFDSTGLLALAQESKLIISCVGPYALYGEPVVKACASSGTHYLDVSGETPWVKAMIAKYHSLAQSTGSIVIHQGGYESAPSDVMALAITKQLNAESLKPKEVIVTVHNFINGGPSGGTTASLLNAFSHFSLRDLLTSMSPSAYAAGPVAKSLPTPLTTRLFGVRKQPDLGVLSTSAQGICDIPLVYRSSTLLKEEYGSNFHFTPWVTVRHTAMGVFIHFFVISLPFIMKFWPLRYLISKIAPAPGKGPTAEQSAKDLVEFRAVGIPDGSTQRRAYGSVQYRGSGYQLTAVFLAEAAATILQDEDIPAKKMGGGSMTPATLGQGLLDRLARADYALTTKMIG